MTTRATPLIDEAKVTSISLGQREPAWLTQRRLDALDAYEALPMPDEGDEEWRRTDMAGFDLDALMARTPVQVTGSKDLLDSDGWRPRGAGRRRLRSHIYGRMELPDGVIFCDLHTAPPSTASWRRSTSTP